MAEDNSRDWQNSLAEKLGINFFGNDGPPLENDPDTPMRRTLDPIAQS